MQLYDRQIRHIAILGRALQLKKADLGCPDPMDPPGKWLDHFALNCRAPRLIDWDDPYRLDETERRTLGPSIATFQLGEEGEGVHLRRCARKQAEKTRDFDYVRACALFIAEEQRHAAELARFMNREGIPRKDTHWSDALFRRLRHGAGLDLTISVLLTAEMIALVYYRALARATPSATLKSLCHQFLREERAHVLFQAGTLGRIRRRQARVRTAAKMAGQRLLFAATLVAVWADHRAVFHAAGFSCRRYWRAGWSVFRALAPLMSRR